MRIIVLIFILFGSGCTTMGGLDPPGKQLSFTLDEDLVVFYSAGLFNDRNARGLLAGTYEAVAEDEERYYFMPLDGEVVRLFGRYAEEFERTGEFPSSKRVEIVGGLWVPKPSSTEKYDIFQVLAPNYDRMYEPGGGGLVQAGAAKLLEGTVIFHHEEKLPDYSHLVFVEKERNDLGDSYHNKPLNSDAEGSAR